MKRSISFILIAVFICVEVALIFLFAANLQFNSAKKLESVYLWQEAKEKYQLAVKLDPFNTQYLAGLGDFLRNKSVYQQDRIAWLNQAEKLYARALELNPHSAQYALHSGQVKLELFLSDKDKFKDRLGSGLNDFKRAVQNDPNSFNISYSVGYAGISVWNNLSADEKEWILGRLRYSFKIKPEYSEYIYPALWKVTKDFRILQKVMPAELVQEKREKLKRIERIKQDNLAQTWQGKSRDGRDIYENGNMYWIGTMDVLVNVPEGKATLKIQARGSPSDGVWPYMIVELDGQEMGEIFVNSSEWKEYSFPIDTDGGMKVLSVTFTNDGGNEEKREDRNLYIGEARIIKNE